MTGHVTVMLDEVVEHLGDLAAGVIVDGTIGQGGHSEALLSRTPASVRLLGLDRDPQAVESSRARLAPFGARAKVLHRSYDELLAVLAEEGLAGVDRVVLDLGLSSVQLASDRGFSFLADAPLDMRFDPTTGPTAAELIRDLDEESLANALWELAEIRSSRRLAKLLKERAAEGRMETTKDLVEATTEVMGPRLRKIASATLPAQALRILVNRELERLDTFLADLPRTLAPGGRAAVIAFHSGEDRRVKRAFRALEATGEFTMPRRKAYKPGGEEVEDNRRARSARLRVIERRRQP